jgi:hypothetical protein
MLAPKIRRRLGRGRLLSVLVRQGVLDGADRVQDDGGAWGTARVADRRHEACERTGGSDLPDVWDQALCGHRAVTPRTRR